MAGNVWEWCADGEESYRVIRGSAWNNDASSTRAAARLYDNPDNRVYDLGFRVVKEVTK